MKLVLIEYLAALKERGELDAILPDLLSELGLLVISRPAIGTRQYGVDVAAVGDLGEGKKVFLFSIKASDIKRSNWDSGEQSLRPSLNEILDVFLRKSIPARYTSLPVVVVLCCGGEIHESVRDNIFSFMQAHTTDRIKFDIWDGNRLADYLLSGVLRENSLPATWRSDFRKALALVDEPDVSFKHFVNLISSIAEASGDSTPKRLSAIRQIHLGLWTLYVWARTSGNIEAAYLCSERSILVGWSLSKDRFGARTKLGKSLTLSMNYLIMLHDRIARDYISNYVEPRAKTLHGLSLAVPSHAYLDVNLKLFDLVGRVGTSGFWQLYLAQVHSGRQNNNVQEILKRVSETIIDMIENNPIFCTPIKDNQAIDINIACLFLKRAGCDGIIQSWIERIAVSTIFAFNENAFYPCVFDSYYDLISHPRRGSDYRMDATCGSVLIPTLAVWAAIVDDVTTLKMLADFSSGPYKHSTLQLWYPGHDTEKHLYLGGSDHGLSAVNFEVQSSSADTLSPIDSECSASSKFLSLSAFEHGLWPLIVSACRHHRVPVPPHFWWLSL